MRTLAQNWWALVLRGVLAIGFGLAAFFWPDITLLSLVLLFGAFALTDGILAIAAAVTGATHGERWWVLVLEGLSGIAIAAVTVIWPGISALALVYLIASWALVTGVLEIAAAIRLRREIEGEWLLIATGVLSVAFGLYAALVPAGGALAIVWTIGGYALVTGILLIALGLRLRGHNGDEVPVRVQVNTGQPQSQRAH
jgi:uncharacterized membrane protein HdeD (DUF308 family)